MFSLSRDFAYGMDELMNGKALTERGEPGVTLILNQIDSIWKASRVPLEELIGSQTEMNSRFCAWKHWRDTLIPEFEQRYTDTEKRARAIYADITHLQKSHTKKVLEIARGISEEPFDEEKNKTLQSWPQNTIGMVAQDINGKLLGYAALGLCKTEVHILQGAVAKAARRHLVGSQIVDYLIGKLLEERRPQDFPKRNRVLIHVRETNLPAQLFFRSKGFRAISVLHEYYLDTSEDAYLMQYER